MAVMVSCCCRHLEQVACRVLATEDRVSVAVIEGFQKMMEGVGLCMTFSVAGFRHGDCRKRSELGKTFDAAVMSLV